MRKPIICQLSDFGPEYPGSFVDSLLCLARHCRETMHLETLCVFPKRAQGRKWLNSFENNAVQYAFLPAKRNISAPLKYLLEDFNPVIFHSHFQTFDLGALLLKVIAYRKAKVVWHFHSIARPTVRQQIKDAIKVRLFAHKFADLFIAAGESAYNNAIERGFPRERLFLNHNGIDINRFSWSESCYGGSGRPISFLLLGYSPLIKGVDLFVKAAEKLSRDSSNRRRFLIVARNETRNFVSRMPEFSRMNGALQIVDPIDDFGRILRSVDVLVVASRTEGLSYAVLEAMAARKLVISSDIPGVRDTYARSDGVRLFPTEDWEELADLMKESENLSPTKREYLGEANSRYVASHHSLEGWAERTVQCYEHLLDS